MWGLRYSTGDVASEYRCGLITWVWPHNMGVAPKTWVWPQKRPVGPKKWGWPQKSVCGPKKVGVAPKKWGVLMLWVSHHGVGVLTVN